MTHIIKMNPNNKIFEILNLDIPESEIITRLEQNVTNFTDCVDSNYLSPVIYSVNRNKYYLTKYLIQNRFNIDYSGPSQSNNPLIIAIKNENTNIIQLLLEADADPNIPDIYLKTACHYVLDNKINIPIVLRKRIVSKCNNVNFQDHNLDSVFNLIVANGYLKYFSNISFKPTPDIYLKNRNGVCANDIEKNFDIFLQRVQPASTIPTNIIQVVSSHKFKSASYNYPRYLLYILNKYPKIKLPITSNSKISITSTPNNRFQSIIDNYYQHSPILLNHLIIWISPDSYFISDQLIDGIKYTTKKYPSTKFILIKLLICKKPFQTQTSSVSDSLHRKESLATDCDAIKSVHANIIIYDVQKNALNVLILMVRWHMHWT